MRVLSYIENSIWAILPSAYDRMHVVATRHSAEIDRILFDARLEPKALLTKKTAPLANTRYVDMQDSTAVIDVEGVIAKRMNMLEDICGGGTSTELLARDFQTALDNAAVHSIVFNIHSPGGDAFGMNELAQLIYSARGQKPIKAYVSGMGCSAAYFIAAACDEVVCDAQAMLGSIGVVSESQDASEMYKKLGIDRKVVTSKNAPKKRLDLNTESGMGEFQSTLDAMEKVFIRAVGKFRNKTFDEVVSDFNQGGVLIGKEAVKAGMADRTGSLQSLIAELNKKPRKKEGVKVIPPSKMQTIHLEIPKGMVSQAVMDDFNRKESATTPETQTNKGDEFYMNLIEKFQAWLENEDKPAEEVTEKIEASVEALPAPDAEKEILRAKLEEAQREHAALIAEQVQARAAAMAQKTNAFVEASLKAGKMTPAETEKFSAAYLQALKDDEASPLESGTRAEALESAVSQRSPNVFLEEKLATGSVALLKADESVAGDDVEMTNKILEATPLGRAAKAQKPALKAVN